MASPYPFHEWRDAVSDTPRELLAYAFFPLAVSLDSMVKMAS